MLLMLVDSIENILENGKSNARKKKSNMKIERIQVGVEKYSNSQLKTNLSLMLLVLSTIFFALLILLALVVFL